MHSQRPGKSTDDYSNPKRIRAGETGNGAAEAGTDPAGHRASANRSVTLPRKGTDGRTKTEPGMQPDATEGWEVLVSAQKIVEIRFVAAPPWGALNADQDRNAISAEQSSENSARNYRTLKWVGVRKSGLSSIRLLAWGLGALATVLLTVWLLLG